MYRIAAVALLCGSMAHILASVIGEFSESTMLFGVLGIAYIVMAVGLFAQQRIAAWVSFLFLLPGLAISVNCLLYTSPSPRDKRQSRMPSSA